MILMHEGLRTRLLGEGLASDREIRAVVSWLSSMEVMPRWSRFRRHPRLQTIQDQGLEASLDFRGQAAPIKNSGQE
jgi:hypothetical protein